MAAQPQRLALDLLSRPVGRGSAPAARRWGRGGGCSSHPAPSVAGGAQPQSQSPAPTHRPPECLRHRPACRGALVGLSLIFRNADVRNEFRNHVRVIKCIFSSGSGPLAGEALGNVNSPGCSFLAQWPEGKQKMEVRRVFSNIQLPIVYLLLDF